MTVEPRTLSDYGGRETQAARRVLVDLGQVLSAWFRGRIVIVGGWVPELLLPEAREPHSGSNDVDIAFDPARLDEGEYADVVETLLGTGRYARTEKAFRLEARVDLSDGGPPVLVGVDFLKPPGRGRQRRDRRRMPGFRPLDADGCSAAFRDPRPLTLRGRSICGAENSVAILVSSVADFLVMKAHALAGRDKPKDAYDICFCLEHVSGGFAVLAADWRARRADALVAVAVRHLREKFRSVDSWGPRQVAEFLGATAPDARVMDARRAFELVDRFLGLVAADASGTASPPAE